MQTQDADTIGAATDTNATSAAFGGVFGATSSGGADGSASVEGTYTLGVPGAGANGVDSGLDQTGANIYLYVISGKVVGSTAATLAGVTAGNTVFDVGVSGTGVVTLTQYSQIDHPVGRRSHTDRHAVRGSHHQHGRRIDHADRVIDHHRQ